MPGMIHLVSNSNNLLKYDASDRNDLLLKYLMPWYEARNSNDLPLKHARSNTLLLKCYV